MSELEESKVKEPEFSGSLAHREPQYVLPLGLIGSFLFHAVALGMVRFAVVSLAGGAAEPGGPEAIEFVAVGADGQVLPPEKTAVFSPPKAGPESAVLDDPDGTAIAQSSPSPSPRFTPTPTPTVTPQVTPTPQPSKTPELPVQPSSQPQNKPSAKPEPRSQTKPAPTSKPTSDPNLKNNQPPSPQPAPKTEPETPKTEPAEKPATSDTRLKDREGNNDLPSIGGAIGFSDMQDECVKADAVCPYTSATLARQPKGTIMTTGLPIGKMTVKANVVFDRATGQFLRIVNKPKPGRSLELSNSERLNLRQMGEVELAVAQFLQQCRYEFVPSDSLEGTVLVEIVATITIDVT